MTPTEESYMLGFIDKCAELGVDPEELVKQAQGRVMATVQRPGTPRYKEWQASLRADEVATQRRLHRLGYRNVGQPGSREYENLAQRLKAGRLVPAAPSNVAAPVAPKPVVPKPATPAAPSNVAAPVAPKPVVPKPATPAMAASKAPKI